MLRLWEITTIYSFSQCSLPIKRLHDHGNFYERKHASVGLLISFRALVHYHHGRKNGGKHNAGAVAENSVLFHSRVRDSRLYMCSPSFTFTASHKVISGSLCRESTDTYLTSAAFLSNGGRFHNPFLILGF